MNKTFKSKFAQAFSLVELLVVIAVIAIIAGIAIPQIVGTREAAVEARDAAQLEEQTRFFNNVMAAGAVDADGPPANVAAIVDGVSYTNAEGIVFTYTQN